MVSDVKDNENIILTPLRIESSLYSVVIKAYHNGVSPSSPFIQKFEDAFLNRGVLWPPEVTRQAFHVRHALISRDDALPILSMCPNIVDLAIWCSIGSHKTEIFTMLSHVSIEKLSICASNLLKGSSLDFLHTPLAKSLTHLDLFQMDGSFWEEGWRFLNGLPKLTHLAVNGTNIHPVIEGIMKESETVTLLVWSPDPNQLSKHTNNIEKCWGNDYRLVSCPYPDNPLKCWGSGAHGGQDMWTAAEGVQRTKMRRVRRNRDGG